MTGRMLEIELTDDHSVATLTCRVCGSSIDLLRGAETVGLDVQLFSELHAHQDTRGNVHPLPIRPWTEADPVDESPL